MVIFGKEKVKPFEDLKKIINKIHSSSYLLGKLNLRYQSSNVNFRNDKLKKYQGVIMEGSEEPDPITPEVERIILEIETICKNIIK